MLSIRGGISGVELLHMQPSKISLLRVSRAARNDTPAPLRTWPPPPVVSCADDRLCQLPAKNLRQFIRGPLGSALVSLTALDLISRQPGETRPQGNGRSA